MRIGYNVINMRWMLWNVTGVMKTVSIYFELVLANCLVSLQCFIVATDLISSIWL